LLALCLLSLTAASAAASPLELTVVSYNVWGVPMVSPDREARIEEIARRLTELDADVVALQELWVPEDATLIAARLADAGLPHHHRFSSHPAGQSESGLFIASRYPIDEVRFEAFRAGTTPYIPWHLDWMARKGVGVVRLKTPAGPFVLANTHFQASYAVGDYSFVQLSQALQLAKMVRADGDEHPPLLVVGDLNVAPDTLPVRVLATRAGLTHASPSFEIDQVLGRHGTSVRLDPLETRSLFEEPVRFASGLERTMSDHPLVLVRYRLDDCAGCGVPLAQGDWGAVASEVVTHLRADLRGTERFMIFGRVVAFVLIALAAALVWRRRRRGKRISVSFALAATLMTFAIWAGYIGWHYAPSRLLEIDAQRATLETGPTLSVSVE
jgi:endonuclease/exonuclease/phosphatase family metal-dependent hydrolase